MRLRRLVVPALLAVACAARVDPPTDTAGGSHVVAPLSSVPAGPARGLVAREGATIARSTKGDALYVADEDHQVVRRIPLPVEAQRLGAELAMPGAPANVLAIEGGALVTIRDPSMLLVLREDARGALAEESRIALPDDAWGIAIGEDERTVVVTSAWSRQVSVVDLLIREKLSSIAVAREPRGVVIRGGVAYVSHLVGADLTRVDGVYSGAPVARRVRLPASPLRAPVGVALDASLGYTLALSPDGSRLYAPRHALGAMGERHWYGAPTVDVLRTGDDTPIAPLRPARAYVAKTDGDYFLETSDEQFGALPFVEVAPLAQPRAVAVRANEGTLLVASEGEDTLVEMSLDALDPSLKPVAVYRLGSRRDAQGSHAFCGAPSGVALSVDERTAYVFCRSTYDLAIVSLRASREPGRGNVAGVRLADDALTVEAAEGRRLFYNATETTMSGGLACAGCHPEGRDDGHTWHEVTSPVSDKPIFVADAHDVTFEKGGSAGLARQTPMLAGRVDAVGPYGWHAQSPDLRRRAMEGFSLHRWDGPFDTEDPRALARRADAVALFLRSGLTPPPVARRELNELERRGSELFASDATGCAGCHVPATGYTDRVAYPLPELPLRAGFARDPDPSFKTPSLRFVGGTGPYFHDGSVDTLADLVAWNGHRMGRTEHLSPADRNALVAFLNTL